MGSISDGGRFSSSVSGAQQASFQMGTISQGQSGKNMKVITHLHVVPKFKKYWGHICISRYAFLMVILESCVGSIVSHDRMTDEWNRI
jgi:hypothetical protein